ncbi:hypothetical protein AKJ16_DCAP01981, partial [Drosera capensis]
GLGLGLGLGSGFGCYTQEYCGEATATAEQDTIFSRTLHVSSVNGNEHGPDSMSNDVCMDEDDCKEFDDFDPYLFIRNLPELSSVVPTSRPLLLPKQARRCPWTTLVLDLDEILAHSRSEHGFGLSIIQSNPLLLDWIG